MVQLIAKNLHKENYSLITSQESCNTIQIQYLHTLPRKKHTIYENIIRGNDFFIQNKDLRHISPPLNIPLVNISTHECNPEKNINTNTNKIQVHGANAHIYDET